MKISRLVLTIVTVFMLSGVSFAALNGAAVFAQGGASGPGLVVFTSNRSGNYEIYVLDPNTGLSTQLTNNPANDVDPVWSSDGSKIVFASDRDGDYELYLMKSDGTGLLQLTNNLAQDVQPRWQPGDQQIVYVSNVNAGQWDLYAITADGTVVRQLTNDPSDERGPGAGGAAVVPSTGGVGPVVITATPGLIATTVPDAIVSSSTLNVRENPGEGARILVTIPRDTALKILGRYSDNSWVQVLTPTNVTGWVYRPLLTVNINLANVPVVNATFMAPPTAIPTAAPTAAPSSAANLVAGIVVLEPAGPTCAQTFNVGFDVANLGTVNSSASGTVSLVDVRTADGTSQGTTIGGFPVLAPGQTFRVTMPLTISTWYNDQHTITLVIDPNNQIPESVETDNVRTITYTLAKGSCP
jgi:dipeptidyl aminopeptidase/acylaminoacyl peptidase